MDCMKFLFIDDSWLSLDEGKLFLLRFVYWLDSVTLDFLKDGIFRPKFDTLEAFFSWFYSVFKFSYLKLFITLLFNKISNNSFNL